MKPVLVTGCFDAIHYAHVELFKFASRFGQQVHVGINSDASVRKLKGEGRPVFNEQQRIKVLESIRYVSWAYVLEGEDAAAELESGDYGYWVFGAEYTLSDISERCREAVRFHGIKIRKPKVRLPASSTALLKTIDLRSNSWADGHA